MTDHEFDTLCQQVITDATALRSHLTLLLPDIQTLPDHPERRDAYCSLVALTHTLTHILTPVTTFLVRATRLLPSLESVKGDPL